MSYAHLGGDPRQLVCGAVPHRNVLEHAVSVVHGDSTRQILATGLVAVLLTPKRFSFPVYTRVEADSTTYLGGTAALPPGETRSPAETVFVAPEVFLGPFRSPMSHGTRVALGASFNVLGDAILEQTYTITAAFVISNQCSY